MLKYSKIVVCLKNPLLFPVLSSSVTFAQTWLSFAHFTAHIPPSSISSMISFISLVCDDNNKYFWIIDCFCEIFSKYFALNWPCYFCCNLFLWYRFAKSRSSLRKRVKEQRKSEHKNAIYSLCPYSITWIMDACNEVFFSLKSQTFGLGQINFWELGVFLA